LLAFDCMPTDFEQALKDIFGEPLNRLGELSREQKQKLQTRLQEYVRECMREEVSRLHTEIAELRARVATLESERAQNAAESLESSF
jgi:polyhydroxyalkanoate synthesis regulator phasin